MSRWALLGPVLLAGALAPPVPPAVPRSVPPDRLPALLALENIPLGLTSRPIPQDAPLTEARVRLGRRLFFDPILSDDRTVACASCHQPEHGFAGPDGKARGIRGQTTTRRAPSLFNRAYGTSFFWDGRTATLEEQALRPIESPTEMGSKVGEAVRRLREKADYRTEFEAAFQDGVTADNLARALAAFERVLLRGDSRVDHFRRKGEHAALTAEERHGLWLYESKGRCWRCHTGANFTDEQYHNTGVSWGKEPADLGRYGITKLDDDRGKFKTPTLRGVALTAPYMHDGSLATLQDVVEFYNKGGGANPHVDPTLAPLGLSPDEVRDLVAFLKAL
jgi:cytochrome c peroxidase